MAHPRHGLDDAFQTPVRFSLMAALGRRTEIDFGTLRDILEADDSVLSKSISYLENVGYVKVKKGYSGSRLCEHMGAGVPTSRDRRTAPDKRPSVPLFRSVLLYKAIHIPHL